MKQCKTCESEFSPVNGNQKYCSNRCRRYRSFNCSQCDEAIIRKIDRKREHRFCSKICEGLYKGKTSNQKCEHCDASFTIKTSALDYGYGKFCSNDCHNESMKRSLTCMCPNCGNLFETGVNEVDRRIYCKKECFYESMMINIPKSELEKLYIDEDLTTREIALIYNTDKKVICDYLHRYEMEVEPATFPGGKMITCKDGHVVRSHYERALDNAFTAHGIEHEYEPRLPFDRRFASDFLVGDVYIEVWGMVGWKPYEKQKQMKKKKKLYEENNLKLFSVYPEDFKDVYGIVRKLKRLIS